MVEARARVHLPVEASKAFAVASDLDHADCLPLLRRIRLVEGSGRGVGSRFEAEANIAGRRLRRILVCREWDEPRRAVFSLEEGMDLDIILTLEPATDGCDLELGARYHVGGGMAGRMVERASAAPARREACRAVGRLAERFGSR